MMDCLKTARESKPVRVRVNGSDVNNSVQDANAKDAEDACDWFTWTSQTAVDSSDSERIKEILFLSVTPTRIL